MNESCARAVFAMAAMLLPYFAPAQGTAITYQGRLNTNGQPANGLYDLRGTIFDAVTGGTGVAGPLTNAPTNDLTTSHIGPMAQDFYAAFAVGADDRHITTLDEVRVCRCTRRPGNRALNGTSARGKPLKGLGRVGGAGHLHEWRC